ncbi:trypsin-like peptidase domain-containing protein [Chloroflexota bacterium]
MNKWVNIAVVSVLLVATIINGVLYFQESGKLNDTREELTTLEGVVSAFGVDISSLQGDVSTLEGGFAGLQTDVATLEGGFAGLQTDVATLEGGFAGLQTDVATLEGGVSTLQGSVLTLEGGFTTLQGDFSTLSDGFSTLEDGVAAMEGNVAALGSDVSSLEGSIATLDGGVAALEDDVSALEARDQAVINVAAMLEPSVVMLLVDLGGGMFGAGSGVVISNDGWILTNWHVVTGALDIMIFLSDGTSYNSVMPHVEHLFLDLAMVKIDSSRTDFTAAALGSSADVTVGEEVLTFGYPYSFDLGIPVTVTRGIISAPRIAWFDSMEYIQTDAALGPGNSGGPLVNLQGEVIGLNNWKFYLGMVDGERVFAEGLNFAIPIDYAKSFIDSVIG